MIGIDDTPAHVPAVPDSLPPLSGGHSRIAPVPSRVDRVKGQRRDHLPLNLGALRGSRIGGHAEYGRLIVADATMTPGDAMATSEQRDYLERHARRIKQLRDLFGPSRRIQGRDKWRVPLRPPTASDLDLRKIKIEEIYE